MKKLNFGAGKTCKEWKDFDNVDIQKGDGIYKSFDFDKFPYPLKDDTYDYVWSRSVLEHLFYPDKVLDELWRVCKNNAIIEIIVPSYNNKSAYAHFQHRGFFSDITFINYVEDFDNINYPNIKKKFEIVYLENIPTRYGKIIPKFIRERLAIFINGIVSYVHIKLKVIKSPI